MRFEFRQGIPEGCIAWLWEHIGVGNRMVLSNPLSFSSNEDKPEYDWYYERVSEPYGDSGIEINYTPTITIKNDELAMIFALRWL